MMTTRLAQFLTQYISPSGVLGLDECSPDPLKIKQNLMHRVSKKAQGQGFSRLALSMVLPHENKPIRFPVVPATHTALLDVMTDATAPVYDNSSKRAFLCRDPSYPLWLEKRCVAISGCLQSIGSAIGWTLPARSNSTLMLPAWEQVVGAAVGGSTIDGVAVLAPAVADHVVLGDSYGNQALYIPPGAQFIAEIATGAPGGGTGIEMEFTYQSGGEDFTSTILLQSIASGFLYGATAGGSNPAGEGLVPFGFVTLRAIRTTNTAPTAAAAPILKVGWATGGSLTTPSGTVDLFLPFTMPPEFNNSVIPYARSRVNASAALFTNVTAALSKEGTILAARLKPAVVDPWLFTASNLNSVHPALRYFGPLEKGLYTFTTPSGNVSSFQDAVLTMPSNSTYNSASRPLFSYQDIGVYNAIIFSDLGSSAAGTQLAVSGYCHIEFETTSSLFTIGVSTEPLELLHATEVALLKFGHFHENPIHWAALASAVRTAVGYLAPMAAPYVKKLAMYAIDKGVQRLTGKPAGDRKMTQKQMVDPTPGKARKSKKGKVVKAKRHR